MPEDETPAWLETLLSFVNPIVFIALLILIAVFVLIGSAIFGFDKGVLVSMGRTDYARGLITYLFAVVTIGTAVVLVVSGLTGTESEAHKERFQRGKEILSLLLGVFGTIVGFYFGSEVSGDHLKRTSLHVATPHLSAVSGNSGSQITLSSFLDGGTPPYSVTVAFDDDKPGPIEKVDANGWYSKTVTLPSAPQQKAVTLHLIATDSEGSHAEGYAPVIVNAANGKAANPVASPDSGTSTGNRHAKNKKQPKKGVACSVAGS